MLFIGPEMCVLGISKQLAMLTSTHTLVSLLLLPCALMAQEITPAWGLPLSGPGEERSYAITLDATGHAYSAGNFTGTVDFDPGAGVAELSSAGSNDIYVAKYDTNGTLVWARSMGGTYSDGASGIAVDDAGNIYITGGFSGTADFDPGPGTFNMTAATTGQNDIYIAKLNANGDFVWAKGIVGGTWWDAGYGIDVDQAGNVLVTGRFYFQGGPRDFDPGPGTFFLTAGHEDIFVLKLTTDCDFVWAVAFGTAPDESRGYSIVLDDAGNSFITGYFRGTVDFDPGPGTFNMTSVGTWNVFYLKLDTEGALIWATQIPVTTSTYHFDGGYGRKIALDSDGNLFATGRYAGTIDFDPGAGVTELTSSGGQDIYLAKFTGAGALLWAKSAGGSGDDEGYGITTDAEGNAHVCGIYRNTAIFDPGIGDLVLTSTGGDDMFIWSLDADGGPIRATSMGGSSDDRAYAIEMSATGALYVSGWFADTADMDPGNGEFNMISAGGNDAFLVKLVPFDNTGIEEAVAGNSLALWPNPASYRTTLAIDANMVGRRAVLQVFNATGEQVLAQQVGHLVALQPLDLSAEWKEGLYMVMVRIEGQAPQRARVVVHR